MRVVRKHYEVWKSTHFLCANPHTHIYTHTLTHTQTHTHTHTQSPLPPIARFNGLTYHDVEETRRVSSMKLWMEGRGSECSEVTIDQSCNLEAN